MIDLKVVRLYFKSRKMCHWFAILVSGCCSTLYADDWTYTSPIFYNAVQDFEFYEKKSIAFPIGERHGFEYLVEQDRFQNEVVSISLSSSSSAFTQKNNRYSIWRYPIVFRITLKGYSLFETEEGEAQYFSFDRAKEREIRRPQFLISFTQAF